MWFHLILPDGSAESIPMGIFYVAEANRKVKTIELKAYDAMLNLEKKFNKGLSSAMPYEFLTLLSKSCHVELAQTKEEIETLTNGTELFGIYQENDIESWRFSLLSGTVTWLFCYHRPIWKAFSGIVWGSGNKKYR